MRTSLVVALLALTPSAMLAQAPFSLELGAGVAVPVQDFGNAELGTGFGFGANVRYRFQPHLLGYAGWEWFHFSADLAPAARMAAYEDTRCEVYGFRVARAL